jgi:hypothetical protein
MKKKNFLKILIVIFLSLSISKATNLKPTTISSPATTQFVGFGFNVSVTVLNTSYNNLIAVAPGNRWEVIIQIKDQANQTIWSATIPGVTLQPYQSATLQTPTQFIPTGSGSYSCLVNVSHLDEIYPDDNQMTKSFNVYGPPTTITQITPANHSIGVAIYQPLSWTNGNVPFDETRIYYWPSPTQIDWNANPLVTSTSTTFHSYTPTTHWSRANLNHWGIYQRNGGGETRSGPFDFYTQFGPPLPVTNNQPINGATDVPTTTNITWENQQGPLTRTDLFLATSPSHVDWNSVPTISSTDPLFTSYNPPGELLPGTTYEYGIREFNNYGNTLNGPWTFTTSTNQPDPITNLLPSNNATNVPTNSILQWTNGIKPITQTDLFLVPSPGQVDWNALPTISSTDPTFHSYDPPGDLNLNKDYGWGVRQYNNKGSTINGPFSFHTQGGALPGAITNIDPQNNATGVLLNKTISWTNGTAPITKTNVHIWPSQSAVNWNTNVVVSDMTSNYHSYTHPTNWEPNKEIVWGVNQFNNNGETRNGPYSFFTQGLTDPDLVLGLYRVNDPYDIQSYFSGLLDITYKPSANGVFINIYGTNRTTSNSAWIVNNLFYPGSNQTTEVPTFSKYFDFTGLLLPNSQVPSTLDLKVYKTNQVTLPPFSSSSLIADVTIPVNIFNKVAINTTTETPIASVMPVISTTHVASDPLVVNVYKNNVRNLDLDDSRNGDTDTYAGDLNACVPTASANSMKWLESIYEGVDLPSDMTLRKTMESLSSKMNRPRNKGTERPQMVKGILDFIEEQNLPLEVKFQSFYIDGNIKSSSEKSVGRNLNTETQNRPQWDFIKEQMKNGEDVIMNYTWYSGGSWYGHSVCLTGVEEFASGVKKIKFKHDADQSNSGGTKEETFEVTVDSEGWVRFGTDNKNFIHTIVAESPIPFGRETAAWLNELFVNPTSSGSVYNSVASADPELIEIALSSQATDLDKFKITLYDGTTRKQYSSISLDQLSKTNYGDVVVYYKTFSNNELVLPPGGIALSYSGSIIPGQFLSYGGSFTALDGDAQAMTSTNIGDVFPGTGLALSGSGKDYSSFGWTYTSIPTSGFLNADQTYTETGPSKPTLSNPPNLTRNLNTTVNFNWSSIQGAQSYDLQYSTDGLFITTVTTTNNILTNSKEITTLSNGLKYYWRVRSKNQSGVSSYSDNFNFTTKLSAPTNLAGQLDIQNKVNLSWIDNSTNEQGFAIEKKLGQGNFSEINRVNPNILIYKDNDVLLNNTYSYRVRAYNSNAESDYSNTISILVTGIEDEKELPTEYKLFQNYPNPFNPSTEIRFALPKESRFILSIYNLLGEKVGSYDGVKTAGYYSIHFRANDLPSGLYIYTLKVESLDGIADFKSSKKMLFIK